MEDKKCLLKSYLVILSKANTIFNWCELAPVAGYNQPTTHNMRDGLP